MQSIRAWFARPSRRASTRSCWQNRSYIFFREAPVDDAALGPIAAAKVPLTPGRSMAVDRLLHTFGTPFYIDAPSLTAFDGKPFRRLMIAQDTGSAITGPARGDLFAGSGDAAGEIAGRGAQCRRFLCAGAAPLLGGSAAMSQAGRASAERRGSRSCGAWWRARRGRSKGKRRLLGASREAAGRRRTEAHALSPEPRPRSRRRSRSARSRSPAASLRPADPRQARQGQAADRWPRRPARHDPGRGPSACCSSFLHRAHAGGLRYVLVITGKGSSFGSDGVLRRAVPAWLSTPPFRPLVSSHDHAARQHGGAGALYVRLRRQAAGARAMTPFGEKMRGAAAATRRSARSRWRRRSASAPPICRRSSMAGAAAPSWPLIQKIIGYFNVIWDEAEELERLA